MCISVRPCRLLALAVCTIMFAVVTPAQRAFPQFPISGVTVTNEHAPNRLIVKTKAESSTQGPKAAAAIDNLREKTKHLGEATISHLVPQAATERVNMSAGITAPHPASQVFIFDFAEDVNLDAIKAEFEAQSWVEYVEYDWLMQLFDTPDDPLFDWQWGMENTGQTFPMVERHEGYYNDVLIWVNGTPGVDVNFSAIYDHLGPYSPVVVGVIDTGSDTEHEDLADRLWHNPGEIPDNEIDDDHNGFVDDYFGYDFSGDDPSVLPSEIITDGDPTDTEGHGTHVAGIVAATVNNAIGVTGLGRTTQIMSIKVFPLAYHSVITQGIYYATDNGVDILNMSFGGPYFSQTLSDAIAYAHSRDVLSVVAAGNTGTEQVSYPAADPLAFTVGALDFDGYVTDFSTYGDHLDVIAPGLSILSLRATGTDMYASFPSYEPDVHIIQEKYYLASGTSMATPFVAGCAAALLEVEGGMSPDWIIEVIENSCIDLVDPYGDGGSYPGWDKYSGHGRVDLNQALNELVGVTIRITSPHEGDMLSGMLVITGTAAGPGFTSFQLDYGEGNDPDIWETFGSSGTPIVDGVLMYWNTGYLTGPYTIRLSAPSGHEDRVTVMLANTAQAQISSPLDGNTLSVLAPVFGSSVAPDYLATVVSFAPEGNPDDTTIIWYSTNPVVDDLICEWAISPGLEGWYYLTLTTIGQFNDHSQQRHVYIDNPFLSGWPVPLPGGVISSPAATDIDNDGYMEWVIPTYSGFQGPNLYVYEEDGSVAVGWPLHDDQDWLSTVALEDFDNDDCYEIVVASPDWIFVNTSTGGSFGIWPKGWQGPPHYIGLSRDYVIPLLCDLDGDYFVTGMPEVLAIDRRGAVEAFYSDGYKYNFPEAEGHWTAPVKVELGDTYVPCPSVIDLDGAGTGNELVIAAAGIWIFNAETGARFNESGAQIRNYDATYGMAIGDFDGGRDMEICVVYIPVDGDIYNLDVLKADGTSLPGWPISTGLSKSSYYSLNSVSIGDVDGDDLPEVFIEPHVSGSQGFVYAYHANGTPLLPGNEDGRFFRYEDISSPVSLADVTNDNQPEILFKTSHAMGGSEALYGLTPDAEFAPGFPINFGQGLPFVDFAPFTADFNNDGNLNMLTVDNAGSSASVWELPHEFSLAGRPWPKPRRDNWNSGVLPSLRFYDPYLVVLMVNYVYLGYQVYWPPYATPDANCDGVIDELDVTLAVDYVYRQKGKPCLP